MADLQIKCINKQPRNDPHDGITHIGGDFGKYTRSAAIEFIDGRVHTFYTLVGAKRAEVGVYEGPNGKYLRTYSDGQWNNNLLALPECP